MVPGRAEVGQRFKTCTSDDNASPQNVGGRPDSESIAVRAVEAFRYAVLLRPVAHSVLSLDAALSAESVELIADVLATLLVAQSEQLLVSLGLSVRLDSLNAANAPLFALSKITARKCELSSMKVIQ